MPVMGGAECLQELIAFDPQVKVLIASGYSSQSKGAGALDSGTLGFVSKPFRRIELLKSVRKALDEVLVHYDRPVVGANRRATMRKPLLQSIVDAFPRRRTQSRRSDSIKSVGSLDLAEFPGTLLVKLRATRIRRSSRYRYPFYGTSDTRL